MWNVLWSRQCPSVKRWDDVTARKWSQNILIVSWWWAAEQVTSPAPLRFARPLKVNFKSIFTKIPSKLYFLASLLCNGRRWRTVVHLYLCQRCQHRFGLRRALQRHVQHAERLCPDLSLQASRVLFCFRTSLFGKSRSCLLSAVLKRLECCLFAGRDLWSRLTFAHL